MLFMEGVEALFSKRRVMALVWLNGQPIEVTSTHFGPLIKDGFLHLLSHSKAGSVLTSAFYKVLYIIPDAIIGVSCDLIL